MSLKALEDPKIVLIEVKFHNITTEGNLNDSENLSNLIRVYNSVKSVNLP